MMSIGYVAQSISLGTRMMTNGKQGISTNNQPVEYGRFSVVHNGIITNPSEITSTYPSLALNTDLDSEIIPALLEHQASEGSVWTGLSKVLSEAKGQISTLIMSDELNGVIATTNFGSLYSLSCNKSDLWIAASESHFLEKLRSSSKINFGKDAVIKKLVPGAVVFAEGSNNEKLVASKPEDIASVSPKINRLSSEIKKYDYQLNKAENRNSIIRCNKCILPVTVPGLTLDDTGVCNYCNQHQDYSPSGLEALNDYLDQRFVSGAPRRVLMGLSGGVIVPLVSTS